MKSGPDLILIELPFTDIRRPSLGLSLVKEAVQRRGHRCEIVYSSINFASIIGERAYELIGTAIPQHLLIGDRIFAADTGGCPTSAPLESETGIPPKLRADFELFQIGATSFIDDLAERIATLNPKLVGLSMMFQTLPSIRLARKIKEINPAILLIGGGSNCESSMGWQLFKHYPQFDFICRGPGELLLPALLSCLKDHDDDDTAFSRIKGLLWRKNGKAMANGESAEEAAMNDQPVPDFSDWLEQLESIFPNIRRTELWLPIESSRGCWWGQKHHCVFCGLNGEMMNFRQKDAQRYISDLETYRKYGIPNIYSTDLIFPYNYFKTFLPKFKENPLSKYYQIFYEIKSNLHRDQLVLLAEAGVRWLQPGIEALDTEILRAMDKGVRAIQNLQLLRWAAEIGISITWNILYGLGSNDAYTRSNCLIPKISHLAPPTAGCFRMRVDRFSPMYESWQRFSRFPPRAARAYQIIHPNIESGLSDIAYHFDYVDESDIPEIASLREAIKKWQDSVGTVSFIHWNDETGRVHLVDRRPMAVKSYTVLTDEAARLYASLEEGRSRDRCLEDPFHDKSITRNLLDEFLNSGWIVELDDTLTSLSCNYTQQALHLTEEIRCPALHVLHCERMARMWKQGLVRKKIVNSFDDSLSSDLIL